jgi:ankyrin repeat protein
MRAIFTVILGVLASLSGGRSGGGQERPPADPVVVERFHDAVAEGDRETVETMLAANPRLALAEGAFGFRPILLVDVFFDEGILDLLLANGADINARNDDGVTILHLITDPEAIGPLLERGADLEARDKQGWTPLMTQVVNQENGPDVVEALLEAGADVAAVGNRGETALSLAQSRGDAGLLRLLNAAGG